MIEARNGLVIRYSYLWGREFLAGEDAGRKDRPVCVQVIIPGQASLLFPITSQRPTGDAIALEVPPIEARRVRLRSPAWIIVDEWNEDNLATSPHVADLQPMGGFSRAFVEAIRQAAIASIRAQRHRRIPRE